MDFLYFFQHSSTSYVHPYSQAYMHLQERAGMMSLFILPMLLFIGGMAHKWYDHQQEHKGEKHL